MHLNTVDSKINENREKIYTNPGNGYFIQRQYNIHRYLPVSMKNSIILLLCIFEPSVYAADVKSKT